MLRLIIGSTATTIFVLAIVYAWREGRFSMAEIISVIAVIVSLSIGAFTFLSSPQISEYGF